MADASLILAAVLAVVSTLPVACQRDCPICNVLVDRSLRLSSQIWLTCDWTSRIPIDLLVCVPAHNS